MRRWASLACDRDEGRFETTRSRNPKADRITKQFFLPRPQPLPPHIQSTTHAFKRDDATPARTQRLRLGAHAPTARPATTSEPSLRATSARRYADACASPACPRVSFHTHFIVAAPRAAPSSHAYWFMAGWLDASSDEPPRLTVCVLAR